MRTLVESDEASFRAAFIEFKTTNPDWAFAFEFDDHTDFKTYIDLLDAWSRGEQLAPEFVPSSFLVGVFDGRIVGRVSIRHELNEYLLRMGGHVGYGVVPSFRRKGFATTILQKTLPVCRTLGIDRLLLTCDDDNIASIKVIEAQGGILENTLSGNDLRVPKRRYWITLE